MHAHSRPSPSLLLPAPSHDLPHRVPTLLQHAVLAARAIVTASSSDEERARHLGYVGMCIGLGMTSGPFVGGEWCMHGGGIIRSYTVHRPWHDIRALCGRRVMHWGSYQGGEASRRSAGKQFHVFITPSDGAGACRLAPTLNACNTGFLSGICFGGGT